MKIEAFPISLLQLLHAFFTGEIIRDIKIRNIDDFKIFYGKQHKQY